jgi:hypothetical protein
MVHSFKKETASDHYGSRKFRPGADSDKEPPPHTRSKAWIAAYVRKDGVKVRGHFRHQK